VDARLLMYAAGLELGGSIAREQANGARLPYFSPQNLGTAFYLSGSSSSQACDKSAD